MQFDSSGAASWSFPMFRIRRIPVRMHWFLALMIAIEIIRPIGAFGARGALYGAITMTILFTIILGHELCHCWMAIRHGGTARQILLWPLGGLATVDHPHGLREDVEVSGIGPVSNFVMAGICAVVLVASGAPWHWDYLFPFASWYPLGLSVPQWFVLHAIRLNIVLGLFNCIPVPPLDGGMVVYAVLKSRIGRARAATICSRAGMVVGVLMLVWAFLQSELMLGFIGFWVIMQSRSLGQGASYDADYGPTSGPKRPGILARIRTWWRKRRQRNESRRIETILDKVEAKGVHSLTEEERRLLRESRKRRAG